MYVGDFSPGQIVYIYFNTFTSDDPSASCTITDFINTDVHIHKDDSLTQRNNASGITVDVDVDAITGSHFIKIDTADNTVADFFTAGHDYFVRIEGTTVDSATINAVVGHFSLDNRMVAGKMVSTHIATLASQTSFTLSAGSADNDAYNGCTAIISDLASGVQKCYGIISDYVGATKTVTLAEDPGIFTMAAGDNITIIAASALCNIRTVNGTLQTANDNGADINDILTDTAEIGVAGAGLTNINLPDQTMNITGNITGNISGSVGSVSGHTPQTGDNYARLGAPAGASVSADIAAVKTDTGNIETDTQDIQSRIPAALVGGRIDANMGAISGDVTAADNAELDYDGTGYAKANSTIGTCTANTDMRGTDNAFLAASAPANIGDLSITAGTGRVDVASIEGSDATDQIRDAVIDDAQRIDASALNTLSGHDPGSELAAESDITSLNNLSAADVNAEVVDVLKTDTINEMAQGIPPKNPTFEEAVMYLYMMLRNRLDVDKINTAKEFYNDAGTIVWKKALSDDGDVYSEAKGTSGA